jgi:hypothetical protein
LTSFQWRTDGATAQNGGTAMGKRSNFEKREADFYATPRPAVVPLVPYLRGSVTDYAEPCCGESDLIRHLADFGFHCAFAGDIRAGQDALSIPSFGGLPVITNPPYGTGNRSKLLLALIRHFMSASPFAWLLIDYDFSSLELAEPVMRHCTDIVIIPRQKWIEDSDDTGKDNHAWYRFELKHTTGPRLHNNRVRKRKRDTAAVPACVRVSIAVSCTDRSALHPGSARVRAGHAHAASVLALQLALQCDASPDPPPARTPTRPTTARPASAPRQAGG